MVLTDQSEIHVGISYSLNGYQTKWLDLTPPIIPDPTYPDRIRLRYRFHYINIPAYYRHAIRLFDNKSFHLKGGLISRVFIKEVQTTQEEFEQESIEEMKTTSYDYNSYVLAGSLGIGYSLSLGDQIRVDLDPKFEFDITRIINEPAYAHLWNVGLSISLWLL